MATLLDALNVLRGFGIFETIIPFILITALVFALFAKYKPFGETKYVNGILATVIGLIVISFAKAVFFINLLIPFITIFLIIVVLALLIFTFIGIKGETIANVFTKSPIAYGLLFFVFLIIVAVVLSQTFPEASIAVTYPGLAEQLGVNATGVAAPETAGQFLFLQTARILFSPQILALVALVVIFGLAAYFITREPGGSGG